MSEIWWALWDEVAALLKEERDRGGVYDIDTHTISGIDAYAPGYIDKDKEQIVGLQTSAPLTRAIMPFGGIRMVRGSLEAYHREMDPAIETVFEYRKTHNDGVFDVYTPQMRAARKSGVITGLPDAYGRGRIIGDYRRIPLYGVAMLIREKQNSKNAADYPVMDSREIRLREELAEQIRALESLIRMAASYGYDISRPAADTKEAIQWLYFGYLAAIKEQNGAAMSIGRISTFLDIYAERDLADGRYTEEEIQEFVDHFVMKLRLVRKFDMAVRVNKAGADEAAGSVDHPRVLRRARLRRLDSGDAPVLAEHIGLKVRQGLRVNDRAAGNEQL